MILNEFSLSHGSITFDHNNTWVWFPKSRGTKVSTMAYSYFNKQVNKQDSWEGWSTIWHLNVAPRVKHFTWLLLHNGLKTHEYLYRLNLGPQAMCGFCNLFIETAEHLLHTCSKSQAIWNLVISDLRKPINLLYGITSGDWLNTTLTDYDL